MKMEEEFSSILYEAVTEDQQAVDETDKLVAKESSGGIAPGKIIEGRYRILDSIGSGGFGEIYRALDMERNDQSVAIKVCRKKKLASSSIESDSSSSNVPPNYHWSLHTEYNVLMQMSNVKGFPKVYKIGVFEGDSYLVMELLGPSLGNVFRNKQYIFSLKSLLIIIDQLLERLQALHGKGILHSDFTPNNILLGTGDNSGVLYLIDFGLSSMYKDMDTGEHFPPGLNTNAGTLLYMSVNAHNKQYQSRKDDMESLAYVIAHFTTHGQLPWRICERDAEKVKQLKSNITGDQLFSGQPREFAIYFELVRNMEFSSEPEYNEVRKLFRRLGLILGVKYDDDDQLSECFDKVLSISCGEAVQAMMLQNL